MEIFPLVLPLIVIYAMALGIALIVGHRRPITKGHSPSQVSHPSAGLETSGR